VKSWVRLSWLFLIAAYGDYISTITGFRLPALALESAVLLSLLGVMISVVNAGERTKANDAIRLSAGALVGWWTTSRLLILWLLSAHIGLNFNAGVTLSWIAYAVITLAIGFTLKSRIIRYWSLGIIFATVLKVFLVDLATLDMMVRVAAVGITGAGILLMSTWYFRNRSMFDQDDDR
jgi:uncharacterized membrane protein